MFSQLESFSPVGFFCRLGCGSHRRRRPTGRLPGSFIAIATSEVGVKLVTVSVLVSVASLVDYDYHYDHEENHDLDSHFEVQTGGNIHLRA